MTEGQDRVDVLLPLIILEPFEQTVVGHLSSVRNEGDDGMCRVSADSVEDLRGELLTELLTLAIDVLVGAAREIDMLKGTLVVLVLREDLLLE